MSSAAAVVGALFLAGGADDFWSGIGLCDERGIVFAVECKGILLVTEGTACGTGVFLLSVIAERFEAHFSTSFFAGVASINCTATALFFEAVGISASIAISMNVISEKWSAYDTPAQKRNPGLGLTPVAGFISRGALYFF